MQTQNYRYRQDCNAEEAEPIEKPKADTASTPVEVSFVEETDDIDNDKKEDNDCDVYIFRYQDNFKVGEAQEAINQIEENLNQTFRKNRVKDLDQVFIESLEDNEFQVKVKMKKNNWPVELSARNVQTSTHPGNPVTVSIKNILR